MQGAEGRGGLLRLPRSAVVRERPTPQVDACRSLRTLSPARFHAMEGSMERLVHRLLEEDPYIQYKCACLRLPPSWQAAPPPPSLAGPGLTLLRSSRAPPLD